MVIFFYFHSPSPIFLIYSFYISELLRGSEPLEILQGNAVTKI